MRKKFTMLLAALLACVGVAKAQEVFSNDNLKEITPGNYYIYYTDASSVKHYLQTTGENSFAIVTEDAAPYAVSVGEGSAYNKAYYIQMNGFCFSNPNPNNNHTLTTGVVGWNADAYISTVVFENGEGLCALRSTNAPVSTWDENYFITHTDDHQVTAQEGGEGGESLFVWTFEMVREATALVNYMCNEELLYTEEMTVNEGASINITAPVFRTITSCTSEDTEITDNGDGTYSCSLSEDATITVTVSETSLDLTQTYRLKNVKSGLYMTIVTEGVAKGVQLKALDEENAGQTFSFAETMTKNGYTLTSESGRYLTASGAWDYSATEASAAGSTHIIEIVSDGVYRLRSVNGYVGSNQDAIEDGSPMYSNHPSNRNTIDWEFVPVEEAVEPVDPFTDFYTNPSGEEALDELGNIELFFGVTAEDVVVNEELQATLTTPMIVDDEYFVASVWTSCYDNEDDPENVFKYIYFELEETYTEPGEYKLTIPEGLFTVNGAPNAATEVYFTVKEPAPVVEFDATIVGVTPAAGEVTELSTIIVQFSNDEVMPQSNIFLTDEAGTEYEFQLDTNHPDYTQAKYVAMNGAITAAGTYTLDCSQIDHATSLWPLETINPFEGTYSWTIKAVDDGIDHLNADADAVIYDIHGRRVEKMTKGLYIVNGKKVVIK